MGDGDQTWWGDRGGVLNTSVSGGQVLSRQVLSRQVLSRQMLGRTCGPGSLGVSGMCH